jgi:hypothetical protein
MSIDAIVEFENQKTGRTRKFPQAIFESLTRLCLEMLPPEQWERAEQQISNMVGEYLDTAPAGEALRMAAAAMFPEMAEDIRFNTYETETILIKLKDWANSMFARYGAPVWLVGSCLTGAGRDVDVRIVLPDTDFDVRFPDRGAWALEVGKQGRWAALFLRMNVDFQIQKASETVQYDGLPRMRIDSAVYPEAYEPPSAGIGAG